MDRQPVNDHWDVVLYATVSRSAGERRIISSHADYLQAWDASRRSPLPGKTFVVEPTGWAPERHENAWRTDSTWVGLGKKLDS